MMNKIIITKDNIEEIIGKQMDNVASSEEIKALTQWRKSSNENESYFQDLIQVNGWYTERSTAEVNVEDAWKSVSKRIQNDQTKEKKATSRFPYSYLRYAASFLAIVCAAWYLWPQINFGSESEKYASNINPLDYELEDGSVIHLTENSALSRISDTERSFSFSGAAKFEVEHDDSNPFLVQMDNVFVKDLGTIFDIDAQPTNDTVFVKVLEGIVQFYTINNEGIMLEFGEEGMYIKSKDKFFKRAIDHANPFLSAGFRDARLDDVVDHLAYAFRKKITLENESIRECNLTVDFAKAPFSVVQEIIEETLNITIQNKNDTLYIQGDSCN